MNNTYRKVFKKIFILILFIWLPVVSFKVGTYYQSKKESQLKTNNEIFSISQPPTGLVDFYGFIRTSGLQKSEKELLGLQIAEYQVEVPCNNDSGVCGYYLEPDPYVDLIHFLGKCTWIRGVIKPGWENVQQSGFKLNGNYTYRRLALIMRNEVSHLDNTDCGKIFIHKPYSEANKIILSGILQYAQRPAPDIDYDYQLKLDNPYKDNNNASGMEQTVDTVIILPADYEISEQINSFIEKKVQVNGSWQAGYAESKFFSIESIEEES